MPQPPNPQQLERVLGEIEKQVEELRLSSAEWRAAGLLSKHKQAEELLRPLEQQVQRIKRLRHGESAEPPSRSTETPPKTTGKSESEDSARGGSAKEATRAYSAPEEVPAGRHRPASSGEPGIGRSSDAHSSSDPWVQECSISPEEWRVAIRVPTAKAASEVTVESIEVSFLEVSVASSSPLSVDIPGGLNVEAARVKYSKKQRSITVSMPRLRGEALAKACNEGLASRMHTVIDCFLDPKLADRLREWLRAHDEDGVLKPGEVEGGLLMGTRGDRMAWVSPAVAGGALQEFAERLDELILAMSSISNDLGSSGLFRDKAMATCYPGDGARYVKHFDNANAANRTRVLTCIIYLNPGWKPEDGGQLRLHLKQKVVDVKPLHNRLAMFWSDHRAPHEVMPSHLQRYAISFWYHDEKVMREMEDQAQKLST